MTHEIPTPSSVPGNPFQLPLHQRTSPIRSCPQCFAVQLPSSLPVEASRSTLEVISRTKIVCGSSRHSEQTEIWCDQQPASRSHWRKFHAPSTFRSCQGRGVRSHVRTFSTCQPHSLRECIGADALGPVRGEQVGIEELLSRRVETRLHHQHVLVLQPRLPSERIAAELRGSPIILVVVVAEVFPHASLEGTSCLCIVVPDSWVNSWCRWERTRGSTCRLASSSKLLCWATC